MSDELVKEARESANLLEHRENIRNGSQCASELRQSPEWRSAAKLREAAARIEELEREKLEAVAAAYEDAMQVVKPSLRYGHPDQTQEHYTVDCVLESRFLQLRARTPSDAEAALEAYCKEQKETDDE